MARMCKQQKSFRLFSIAVNGLGLPPDFDYLPGAGGFFRASSQCS
jgi:hypothetical protein